MRLLRVTRPGAVLKFDLITYPRQEAPLYRALSHAWGKQYATQSIVVGKRPIPLSPRMKKGIEMICASDQVGSCKRGRQTFSINLWVDTVCNNQANDAEKALQVRATSEISSDAVSVLVWLGTAADSSDCAMDSLSGLVPRFWALQGNYDNIYPSNAETFGLPGLALRTALAKLYERSWFKRLWVM